MGAKNRFRDLQLYSTKEVKFNQDKHLPVAKTENPTNADIEAVQSGVCAAAAMQYLLDSYKGTTMFQRGKGVKTVDMIANKTLILKFAAWQHKFKTGVYRNDQLQGVWDLAESMFTLVERFNGAKTLSPEQPKIELTAELLKGRYDKLKEGGYWISYDVESHGAHAVAVFRLQDGSCKFFDANIGAYHIQKANFDTFFQRYVEIYASAVKWKITEGIMFFMRY